VSTEDDRMLSDEEHDEALPGKLLYLVLSCHLYTALYGVWGTILVGWSSCRRQRPESCRVSTLINGKAYKESSVFRFEIKLAVFQVLVET
jgi:hypothetical protein